MEYENTKYFLKFSEGVNNSERYCMLLVLELPGICMWYVYLLFLDMQ